MTGAELPDLGRARWFMALAIAALLAIDAPEAAEVAYYPVPAGSRPHDVAPAPDGTVWYTAQGKGELGRLDPKTGKIEIIPLGPGSAPHGVIVGPDGAAWVTDGGLNANVRVDPETREVRPFPLPPEFPNANLNTGTFDKKGVYWFTGQGGVYGRVDPATGKTDAWKAPKGYGPYGMTTTPSGDIWYASLAGDYIAHIDPVSGEATTVEPPREKAGTRRVWSDSRGILWVSLWHAGALGRYDPASKSWKTWPVNAVQAGCYAVYVDEKDKVWATDFMSNAIVRFDPATETFERFVSNKRAANVRQLLGRPGEVWGAESGTDRLVVIRD
ncbi:MAG: lyase [Pseudorhodoplanes sp.]|nr:lyase [Pseudorhodoplanes sp.]